MEYLVQVGLAWHEENFVGQIGGSSCQGRLGGQSKQWKSDMILTLEVPG